MTGNPWTAPRFLHSGASPMKSIASLIHAAAFAALLVASTSGCRRAPTPDTSAAPAAAVVEAINRGVGLMGRYDYDGATQAFTEALAAAPDDATIQVNLAIARFNRGKKEHQDIEQATALLDAVLTRDPGHVRAWYFKSILLQHQGDAAAAVPCLEKVLAQHPDDGVAWYILGMCKQRIGQDPERELVRAIELRPYLVSAYYRLWQTLQAAGQTGRAAPYLEQFKQLREHPLAETIELPQYNQMGDLALAIPLAAAPTPPHTPPSYHAGAPRELSRAASTDTPAVFGSAAFADLDRDGRFEALACGWTATPGSVAFWKVDSGAPVAAALGSIAPPLTCAIGDYDNDESPDLLVVTAAGNRLFHSSPAGTFTETTTILPAEAVAGPTRSALWFDADHDGDLDLLLCNVGAPSRLLRNNADPAGAAFTDITEAAGLAASEGDCLLALPGDVDGDRDMDLVLLGARAPALVLLNDLSGRFHAASGDRPAIDGARGGTLQDFDGDGHLDILALGDRPAVPALYLGDGHGHFRASPAFAEAALAAATFGVIQAVRAVDIDLDGDLDVAVLGEEGHLLLHDSAGAFALQGRVWAPAPGAKITGAEIADLTGDLVPDLLMFERGETDRVLLIPGVIEPAPTALAIAPTGVRSRDKRTRSPASGYGVAVTVRTGLREQARLITGQSGGFAQSPLPAVFGLAGAPRADYVRLAWPDSVAQIESALPAGRVHTVAETQRKVSSCPVLFTWNGTGFEFITDFAGVGGLGYYVAPGEYAPPQPLDYVKIEPEQLRPRDGRYEVRITEPMEESAYVDRLDLLAIDHPERWQVFPDERLAVTGPSPTHELLTVAEPVFAQRAVAPAGEDCTAALRQTDRRYAFAPVLDRRFVGFCEPHTLELDFAGQLTALPANRRVFLFITGYLEYPYSQTTYAAAQAGTGWQPIRIDRRRADGSWETIVPDAGALGGMSRTITVDLTGLLTGASCALRLTSNLEIYYDQVFLAAPVASDRVTVRSLPVADAALSYHGFAREISPDGRDPLIYTYDEPAPSVPFRTLSGAYTRYGPVRELLTEFDDQFVLMGSGDELAASFDATTLPPVAPGMARSFVLVSHAYCKDMDPYTGTPDTLEPMPFSGMTRYPYPAAERPPETPAQRRVRETYHTRMVK